MLEKDSDKQFILDGISNGFRIVDSVENVKDVYCKNYKSVLDPAVKHIAEEQIIHEIEVGNYVVSGSKPTIVSSLGAIIKDSGKVRLIHDCSRPVGLSVNSYASKNHFKYETVDNAVKLLPSQGYMAKIDLSSAYRSVPIHPSCFEFMGLSWTFEGDLSPTFLFDTRLPFGASTAPEKFQRISNSISRYMRRQGYTVVSYLDDFLIIDSNKEKCLEGHTFLLSTLENLGFTINWNKVEPPSQVMTFLGIEIDSIRGTLSLPQNKLQELRDELSTWQHKSKATKHELQKLIGRLNWGAKVIKGGRTFLRRLIDIMCKLKRKHHHIRLTRSAKADIHWWANFISQFNGTAFFYK